MESTLPPIDELTEESLMAFIQSFLDINQFRRLQNGKALLEYLSEYPQHPKIKTIMRKVLGLFHTDSPSGKVCALQFIKEAMETNNWAVVEAIQKSLLPKIAEIIQYRPHIRSIQRGSSYFIQTFDKNISEEEFTNLVRFSTTFFKMIHECVYVWGAFYFPASHFDRLRIKLQKRFQFPKYPDDFKFFNQAKIKNFKQSCREVISRMEERVEEINSQSSIEKKRQTSVKPKKISSMLQKQAKSQSTDQLTNRSIKQLEKQLNSRKNKEGKEGNPQKFSHKPKSKKKKLESHSKDPEDNNLVENRSGSLRKKNSFNQNQIHEKDNQKQISCPTPKKQNNFGRERLPKQPSIDESIRKNNEKLKFKTITEDDESQGGRYQFPSSDHDISSEFSQIEYQYEDRLNISPRSQHSLINKNEFSPKKYTSQQIVDGNPTGQSPSHKQPKPSSIPIQGQNKIIQDFKKQTIIETNKRTESIKERDISQKRQKEPKKFRLPIEEMKKHEKRFQDKLEQNKNSKRGLSSGRKKFISSQEQHQKEKEPEGESSFQPSYSQQKKQIQRSKESYQRSIQSHHNIEKQVITNMRTDLNNQNREDSPAKELKLIKGPTANQSSSQQSIKSLKPKKIKADHSVKTVFEEVKKYAVTSENVPSNKIQKQSAELAIQEKLQTEEISSTIQDNKKQAKKEQMNKQQERMKRQSKSPLLNKSNHFNETKIQQQKIKNEAKSFTDLIKAGQVEEIVSIKEIKSKTATKAQPRRKEQPEQREKVKMDEVQTPDSSEQSTPRYNLLPQNQESEARYKNITRSRFKKYAQISLAISPSSENYQPMDSWVKTVSNDELKSALQEQLRGQFEILRTTLVSMQQDSLSSNMEQLKSTILGQQNGRAEKGGIECGIQTKSRLKSRSKFYKKKQFMEQSIGAEDSRLEEKNEIEVNRNLWQQNNDLKELKKKQKLMKISNQPSRKGSSVEKRGSSMEKEGNFEPNTLLYALYRKKSMNL